MDLQRIPAPDKSGYVTGYSRRDPGASEFYDMVVVELMFFHCRFVWMSKPYVPVVLFHSCISWSTSHPAESAVRRLDIRKKSDRSVHQPYWLAPQYCELTLPPLPFVNSLLGQPAFVSDSWPLKMGPMGWPETSVRNYHCSLRNNTEERGSHLASRQ
jgi:hypothetical protein